MLAILGIYKFNVDFSLWTDLQYFLLHEAHISYHNFISLIILG